MVELCGFSTPFGRRIFTAEIYNVRFPRCPADTNPLLTARMWVFNTARRTPIPYGKLECGFSKPPCCCSAAPLLLLCCSSSAAALIVFGQIDQMRILSFDALVLQGFEKKRSLRESAPLWAKAGYYFMGFTIRQFQVDQNMG